MRVCQFRHGGTPEKTGIKEELQYTILQVDCSLSNRCVGGNTRDGKTLLHCGQAESGKTEFGQRSARILIPTLESPLLPVVTPAQKLPESAYTEFAEEETMAQTAPSPKMAPEVITRLRSLAHDLSNSIETVMQASYLLAQAKLEDPNKKWVELIDNAARDSARINREIREILRSQS